MRMAAVVMLLSGCDLRPSAAPSFTSHERPPTPDAGQPPAKADAGPAQPGTDSCGALPNRFFTAPIDESSMPPPISGGTLTVLADGHTAVAADPDRDRVWIANLDA